MIAVNGRSLLNLNYEEAMGILLSSGKEVEIVFSQFSADKSFKSIEESGVELIKNTSVNMDSIMSENHSHIEYEIKPEILSEVKCRGVNLVSLLQPKSSQSKTVEDSYLNNIRFEMASEMTSGDVEMVSTPIPTPLKSRNQSERLAYTPTYSNHNGIKAVCCVTQADDD